MAAHLWQTVYIVPTEFTVQSSPHYRSLEVVLPSARSLRAQQAELTQRRAETLRAISQELQAAMALGHDSCILQFAPGWRVRALEQAGYQVWPAPPHYGEQRHIVYFGDRDAAERAALMQSHERPDGPSAAERDAYAPAFRAPSPPSPSVYTRSVFMAPSPPSPAPVAPPLRATPAPQAVRPPFDRAATIPGPEYQPRRPERGVAFQQDIADGAYQPAPGRRF